MRLTIACLMLPVVAGCSTELPRLDGLASRDVPCLHHQVFELRADFKDATAACRVAMPDLTGSGGLQQTALAAGVPFTIRPDADAELKQAQAETITGSNIPYPGSGDRYNNRNGIFRVTGPLLAGP